MAALILFMLGLGLYMTRQPLTDPMTFKLFQLHKSVGFIVLGLAVLRLAWGFANLKPAYPVTMKLWEKVAAILTHKSLYLLMFLIPLSGWLVVSASPFGIPTRFFDLFTIPHLAVPSFLGGKQQATELLGEMHEFLAYILMGLVVLHVSAALKHHFIDRDGVLRRMTSLKRSQSNL